MWRRTRLSAPGPAWRRSHRRHPRRRLSSWRLRRQGPAPWPAARRPRPPPTIACTGRSTCNTVMYICQVLFKWFGLECITVIIILYSYHKYLFLNLVDTLKTWQWPLTRKAFAQGLLWMGVVPFATTQGCCTTFDVHVNEAHDVRSAVKKIYALYTHLCF